MYDEYNDEDIIKDEIENIISDSAFISEMNIIKKYKLSESTMKNIEKYYINNYEISYEHNNISKSLTLLINVLSKLGFDSKEMRNYINSNNNILEMTYSDFAIRLAMFERIGYLEEILFKNQELLSMNSIKKDMSNRELFRLLHAFNFNIEYETLLKLIKTPRKDRIDYENESGYTDFYIMKSIFNSFRNKIKHNNIKTLKK